MIPDHVKAQVLMAFCEGSSLTESGRRYGLSPSQARGAISRLCRALKLPGDGKAIRANPKLYRDRATRTLGDPCSQLGADLRTDLKSRLLLRSEDDLTPRYIANITAEALLNAGFSELRLAEIQDWLVRHGTSLKRAYPSSSQTDKLVRKSIAVLDAFGFDVANVRGALNSD